MDGSNHKDARSYSFFLVFLCISSFYLHPHYTGQHLFNPSNALFWLISSFCIYKLFNLIIQENQIYISKEFMALFWLTVIFSLVTFFGINSYKDWALRFATILIILLLYLCLLQIKLCINKRYIFYGLSILGLLHALGAIIVASGLTYYTSDQTVYKGFFAQPNVLASFLAVSILISFYILLRSDFRYDGLIFKQIPYISVFCCGFVLMGTGSRVGLLGLILGLLALLLVQHRRVCIRLKYILLLACVLVLSVVSSSYYASDPLEEMASKVERMSSEHQGEARVYIYKIGLEVIKESGLLGHGIGSFQSAFHAKAAEIQYEYGSIGLIGNSLYTHPHNELIYWGIETGYVGIAFLLLICVVLMKIVFNTGIKQGLTAIALLMPLILHTQLELPFYHSAFHLFVLVLIVFAFTSVKSIYSYTFNSLLFSKLVKYVLFVFFIVVMLFTSSAFYFSYKLPRVNSQPPIDINWLYHIKIHPVFKDITELSLYEVSGVSTIEGSSDLRNYYINWMKAHLEKTPNPIVFRELIKLYLINEDYSYLEKYLDKAIYYYPGNLFFLNLKNCLADEWLKNSDLDYLLKTCF